MKKTFRKYLTPVENRLLTDEIFITVEIDGRDGESSFTCAFPSREDAVDAGDHNGQIVATYKLVKVENLALKRATTIVPAPVKK